MSALLTGISYRLRVGLGENGSDMNLRNVHQSQQTFTNGEERVSVDLAELTRERYSELLFVQVKQYSQLNHFDSIRCFFELMSRGLDAYRNIHLR